VETFPLLRQDTRDVYQGFAEGVNFFIRMNAADLPDWMRPDYRPQDVMARDVSWPSDGAMNGFRRRLESNEGRAPLLVEENGVWRADPGSALPPPAPEPDLLEDGQQSQNVGSNAWALAPERTESGNAILLRNPHLSWTAGYYEAHLRVPGKLDFYGDYRIGGPFSVIGGFNPDLGFATTNNAGRTHEFYAFLADPSRADHIMIDGASVPLELETVRIDYVEDGVSRADFREYWTSPFGPVIEQIDSLVYVYRPTLNGEYRAGEQWLLMMQATNLEEWRAAMRIEARATSNFTYADRDGNIQYVWVSALPDLPHPAGGDTLAIFATRADQVWTDRVPFDSLPQLLNPPGGYLHNENDSPHFANMNAVMDPASFSFYVQPPTLRLRSQHALELLDNDRVFSLEDVVQAKHSMGMLLADRVKDDLVRAVRATGPVGEVARAIDLIEEWDNTAAAESRGALLFDAWWAQYRSLMRGREIYEVPWSLTDPAATPRGLRDLAQAGRAFELAIPAAVERYGGWDVAWGEVHRVRRGDVDVPVGGCGGALGCFRVLNFANAEDGKRVVNGGDGWVLAVEFGDEPRAYTVLGYGQTTRPESPYHDNQAEMFAAGEMKPVLWRESEIEAAVAERYRPGDGASTGTRSRARRRFFIFPWGNYPPA